MRTNLPYEDLGNLDSTWNPPTSTLPRRPSPASAMVYISRMNKLECVPQPVEARISENAPRGAREREFSSGVPPSGSRQRTDLGLPFLKFPEHLVDPSGSNYQRMCSSIATVFVCPLKIEHFSVRRSHKLEQNMSLFVLGTHSRFSQGVLPAE